MQYVPSSDKEFLATLLCNRALAHYNIGNYHQGLTDAKSCTRFRPEWYKVGLILLFSCDRCGLMVGHLDYCLHSESHTDYFGVNMVRTKELSQIGLSVLLVIEFFEQVAKSTCVYCSACLCEKKTNQFLEEYSIVDLLSSG